MEKIKKLSLILMLTLLLIMGFANGTYAALNCSTNIISLGEAIQGEEIEVSVGISNIQGENGVLIFGGTVEYDKEKLTYVGRRGEGDWSLSYNTSNGKFVADRDNGFAKNNETVFTLRFKVNENVTGIATIIVKDAVISDAKEEKTIGSATKTINIKAKNTDKPSGGDNQGGNQGGSPNQGGNSNQGNNGNQGGNQNQGNNQNGSQNGNQNQGVNQGNKPNNSNQGQGNAQNNNNQENTNNSNGTVTGIDQNRVNEENTVQNSETVVKQTDYTSKDDPVKLHKQEDYSIIIYVVCIVGAVVIIVIIIFAKKKLK